MKKIIEKMPNRLYHILGISILVISGALIVIIAYGFVINLFPIIIQNVGTFYGLVGTLAAMTFIYGIIKLLSWTYYKIKYILFRRFGHIKSIINLVYLIKICLIVIGSVLLVVGAIVIIISLVSSLFK